jgi:uncharacterized membrane protein
MRDEATILFWWLMFGGTHIIGSTIVVRAYVIGKIGNLGFKAVYSFIALATFVPLCLVYFAHKHAGQMLFPPNSIMQLITHILMLGALIVLFQGLATSNPMTTQSELTKTFSPSARGIQRITRHPQNFSFALFGLAHLLVNPYLGDWIFFFGFIIYGVASALHQDQRMLITGPKQVRQFQADTSALPFYAIQIGKQRLALNEYNPYGLMVAIIVVILLRIYHPVLFGGFGF